MPLSKLAWTPWARLVAFWTLVSAVVWTTAEVVPWFDLKTISDVAGRAMMGDIRGFSTQAFAFAIASGIGAIAIGFLVAFGALLFVEICLPLRMLRRQVIQSADMTTFAKDYEATRATFEAHPLIGHAWKKFDETLIRRQGENIIRNTVRPQTFINLATAREKLFGLKMMGAIPGYFVGIGLLLTFLGLVLALNEAAAAVSGSDAIAMQAATRNLLQVATFKFATSIAGLGASIVLSITFRAYTISMEAAFDRFCQAVEEMLRYQAPQSIASETKDLMEEQVAELKAINSADFFARMGEEFTPRLHGAMTAAMGPITEKIEMAVGQLAEHSQTGIAGLLERFSDSVQNGAGTELRELAATLKEMQGAMFQAQQGISGSGEDFGRRMSEAAESLKGIITDAGVTIRSAVEQSRHVADAFQQTAQDVRAASVPLAQSGERIASVTENFGQTIGSSIETLEASQVSSKQLAEALTGHVAHMGETWRTYAARFEAVDEHLAGAVRELGEATQRQAQQLADYASKVDQGFASAIDKLNPLLSGISDNTEELGTVVENLGMILRLPRAAE
jgi:uncharacterized protein YukE